MPEKLNALFFLNLQAHSSLDQATDYLLVNPVPPQRSSSDTTGGAGTSRSSTAAAGLASNLLTSASNFAASLSELQNRTGASAAASVNATSGGSSSAATAGGGGGGEQDDLMRAIAMSLGENVIVTNDSSNENSNGSSSAAANKATSGSAPGSSAPDPEAEEEDLPEEEYEPLGTSVIDDFATNALTGCLSLLDSLPDSVYRVCDLLLAVFNRNGPDFKESILKSLINEVYEAVSKLNDATNDEKSFVDGDLASKAAVRIHLFTLLFEECKVLAAKIVDESNIVMAMTHLLSNAPKVLSAIDTEKKENEKITPKWMTPLLLFIDLHEKVILGMSRRTALEPVSCIDD